MESFRWYCRNCLRLKNICFWYSVDTVLWGLNIISLIVYIVTTEFHISCIFLEPDVQFAFALRAQNLHKIACLDVFAGLLLLNLLRFFEQLAALGEQ